MGLYDFVDQVTGSGSLGQVDVNQVFIENDLTPPNQHDPAEENNSAVHQQLDFLEEQPVYACNPPKTVIKVFGAWRSEPTKLEKRRGPEYALLKKSLPWVEQNQVELLSAGWTKPQIYRRGKFRWPYGTRWGLVFSPAWRFPLAEVDVNEKNGDVVFWIFGKKANVCQVMKIPL